ncbi:MAG: PEP-CTERM sorting domain-containing protein [Armatimonadota bacterium]|nr:PEP-CTERM sorting domain-containing protein [Armatimonadota bacterium]
MKTKRFWFICLLTLLAAGVVGQEALCQPRYALATTPSELFLFRDSGKWGTKSWVQLFSITPGSSALAGVASDGRYVYVVDQTARTVIVGTVGNVLEGPVWQQVAVVTLRSADGKEVPSPRQIAADGLGGFYVTGGASGGKAYFAHVRPNNGNWSEPVVSIGELASATIVDVAVTKSGQSAIIAHIKDTPSTRSSWTCRATAGAVSDAYSLLPNSYNARAVAMLGRAGSDGYAYVANYNSDSTFTMGSIRVVDAATGIPKGTGATLLAPSMIPDDIAAFTVGENSYLAIIGRASGTGAAWRIALDQTGEWLPLMDSVISAQIPLATGHQCAASDDGELLWYTSEDGTLRALRTTTWTTVPPSEFDGTVGESAKLIYVAGFSPLVIPEPSSGASLAALVCGSIAVLRRKRS